MNERHAEQPSTAGPAARTHEAKPSCARANLVVRAAAPAFASQARHLAEHLSVPFEQGELTAGEGGLALVFDECGLSLREGALCVQADFSTLTARLKTGNVRQELLVKAAKVKHPAAETPTAVDATAGLGKDALLLAAAGFSVHMVEYNPVIAALLRDALRRAASMPQLAPVVARMQLTEADSVAFLASLDCAPDVIVLDPMFPARTKSAAVKKTFQLLHKIEQPCSNEEALLQAALNAHPRKVVIKRPVKGPFLAGVKPSYSLSGKAVRYDCIALP